MVTKQWAAAGASKMAEQRAVVMEEVNDPSELATARAQDVQFERNFRWFQSHATEIFTCYRGKCVVIAGQELFAADKPAEAWALAEAAHPEDDGSYIYYIPKEKVARVYARRRRVGAV
jgi:hypothetical protein